MRLSVIVGTYNRLQQLKKCIESILSETSNEVKVYVTDAGSTDGTIKYLESIASGSIIPIFVGKKIGQAKAYNDVFNLIDTPYACWLSDDNIVVNKGLDTALEILSEDSLIGMVALKTKDIKGPFVDAPYIGGISSIGILNVNQGVLPAQVLREAGGFSEAFRDYGIDADLTAKVLFAGYKIVYTKQVSLHHYRNWAIDKESNEYQDLKDKHKKYYELYDQAYLKYSNNNGYPSRVKHIFANISKKLLASKVFVKYLNKGIKRDFYNILNGRYISIFDLFLNLGKKYYLVQSLPKTEKRLQV